MLRGAPLKSYARAAIRGAVSAIRVLLELGTDMRWGHTPARFAAYFGHVDSMREFLNAGLDISLQDMQGRTIPHTAIIGKKKMLKYLLGKALWGRYNVYVNMKLFSNLLRNIHG
jgi:ankyrin repeat protein